MKNVMEYKTCVLIFSIFLSQTFLTLRKIQRDFTINLHISSCKVPVILVRFLTKLEISPQTFEKF